MQNASVFQSAGRTRFEAARPDFHAVMAYEDFASGLRVKEFFDQLVCQHGKLFRFLCHLWKFDLLQAPELKDEAMREAAAADMIVIAAHGEPELPPSVRRWIEYGICNAKAPGALVALLDGPETTGGPVRQYLAQLAAGARTTFLCKEIPSPAALVTQAVEPIQGRDWKPFMTPVADFHPAFICSHFGINE